MTYEPVEKQKKEIREDLEKITKDPKLVDLIFAEMDQHDFASYDKPGCFSQPGWSVVKCDTYNHVAFAAQRVLNKHPDPAYLNALHEIGDRYVERFYQERFGKQNI